MFRSLRRRIGIASGRAAVRNPLPPYIRGVVLTCATVLGVALAWWAYSLANRQYDTIAAAPVAPVEVASQDESAKLIEDIADLRQRLARAERQVEIERATYGELGNQLRSLALENASLKEDLAFFQTLMPPVKGDQALSVGRFAIEKDVLPGEYRYRLLLLHMAPFAKEFAGSYQLVVELMENGKKGEMVLSNADTRGGAEFRLRFKSYQRLEGRFRVSDDAQVRRVQIRVFEDGSKSPRLAHTIAISQEGADNVH